MKKVLVFLLIAVFVIPGFYGTAKAMSGLTVTASPATVSSAASYMILFTTTSSVPAGGTISILFTGFTVPQGAISNLTVNLSGGGASISTITGSGSTVTITLAATAMPAGNIHLFISSAAGIQNPATAATYPVFVYISESESSSYPVPITGALQTVTATVTPLNAGSVASYYIQFSPGISLTTSDYIYITFPTGSTVPVTIPSGLITVNGVASSYVVPVSSNIIRINVPIAVTAGGSCVVYIPQSVSIQNPPTAGSYSISVYTSKEMTPISSAPYTLVGSNITNLYVTVSPNSAGAAANYIIQFITGSSGALAAGNAVSIIFPAGTVVPYYASGSYITINGYACTTTSSGTTLTIYVPSGLSIGNSSWVYVSISSSFGIINPTSVGTYTLQVSTSKDTIPATSNSYSITGTSVSNLLVTVTPATRGTNAAYNFTFTTSSSGALTAASDKINIGFASQFVVPSYITAGNVTVNGTQANYVTVSGDNVAITVPVYISSSASVTVSISTGANITNPPTSGDYDISLSTSKDTVSTTDTVQIVKSLITKPVVTLTGYSINDNVGVTVSFNTGSGGALQKNLGTISIQFPTGFYIPYSLSIQYITVNNYQAFTVNKSGTRIDITPSVNIPASSPVTVIIGANVGIKNPSSQGSYKLTVYTSEETTPMSSDSFNIVTLPKTTAIVAPVNPNGQNGYYIITPKVTLTATSPVDNNPTIYYYFDSGNPVQYTGPISVPDGVHTLYFYAVDRYQNKEAAQNLPFKVDTQAPSINVTSPANNAVLNTKTFTITGTTEVGATLTINGNPVTVSAGGNFSYNASISGPASFTIAAKDVAGNTSQYVLSVSLDTTPPVLDVSEPKAFEEIHTQFVTVKGKTEKDAKVTINGTDVAVNPSDYTFSYSLSLATAGLNSIQIVAVDLAGNQTTLGIPVNYVPKTTIVLQVGNLNGIVNDKTVKLDAAPKIINNRTLVPLRFIAEAFGANVQWEPVFKLVIIQLNNIQLVLQIGTSYASVGGRKNTLDSAPIIDKGTTLVPIRFIAEALNSSVEWDSNTKTVTIVYPK